MFGDETSIGLANTFRHQDRATEVLTRFEVDDGEAGCCLTAQLGLGQINPLASASDMINRYRIAGGFGDGGALFRTRAVATPDRRGDRRLTVPLPRRFAR